MKGCYSLTSLITFLWAKSWSISVVIIFSQSVASSIISWDLISTNLFTFWRWKWSSVAYLFKLASSSIVAFNSLLEICSEGAPEVVRRDKDFMFAFMSLLLAACILSQLMELYYFFLFSFLIISFLFLPQGFLNSRMYLEKDSASISEWRPGNFLKRVLNKNFLVRAKASTLDWSAT